MQTVSAAFQEWLGQGGERIGEVHIGRTREGGFVLTHWEDAGRSGLEEFTRPEEARAIANLDGTGEYRPLKTAPTLRHGWVLKLATFQDLLLAVDFFYPAMLGVWVAHQRGSLKSVSLRETLTRQSGMYAVTKKLTDEAADKMIASFCASRGGCLKTILWAIGESRPVLSLPPEKFDPAAEQLPGAPGKSLPLLCHEACNLLVAEARKVVKASAATANLASAE
jgi:sirohydrochlorin cobaltochelatase